jgi:hypothetical protein
MARSFIGMMVILGACSACGGHSHESSSGHLGGGGTSSVAAEGGASSTAGAETVTATPTEIDDVLVNPGIGFADFSVEGSPASFTEYPRGTVGYVRWTWAELEPTEGQYDFARVDRAIATARDRGETLAFRIMPCWEGSSPKWLLEKGVNSVAASDGTFPDHNSPIFLQYHERLVRAFGARYAGSLDIDHVDIGSVGCWGEWNTACCDGTSCDALYPTETNQLAIIDWYIEAFAGTPLVALIGGPSHAESRGAGWRGDCFGDYGFFGPDWNHMDDTYQAASEDPLIGNAWKTAPVQFEACGVMQDWYDAGYDIDRILAKGLEWHLSVFNGKSSPVPASWRSKIDEWQKRLGYRFVLTSLTHTSKVTPGGSLVLQAKWENRGVAPAYHPWPVAFRLRTIDNEVAAVWTSAADVRKFLPGTHVIDDPFVVPKAVARGTYSLDVGILSEDAAEAHVRLAIAGVRKDLWYALSTVTIE